MHCTQLTSLNMLRIYLHRVKCQASVLPPLCSFFVGDRYTVIHWLLQSNLAVRRLSYVTFSQEFRGEGRQTFFATQHCLVDYG